MKKLICLCFGLALAAPVFAQDAAPASVVEAVPVVASTPEVAAPARPEMAETYAIVDAVLGHRFHRFSLLLNAYNLTDERDETSESEFSQVATSDHAQSYYRLPARAIELDITLPLGADDSS